MLSSRSITPEITILPSEFPLPGYGMLAINAYVLKAQQPVLIDTGLNMDHDAFIAEVESVIDPRDLRWIYLTHPDQDHVGALMTMLERAPQARLITTFGGVGMLSLFTQPALDRVYLLNPGEELDIGDRTIRVLRPPTFDNPMTTGFYDPKSRVLFSSDCFGALLPEIGEAADAVDPETLRQGQITWTTVDAAWLHDVDQTRFATKLSLIRQMEPELILSAHLPPATGAITERMLRNLADTPDAPPFVGPNQAGLEAMLAQMTGAGAD